MDNKTIGILIGAAVIIAMVSSRKNGGASGGGGNAEYSYLGLGCETPRGIRNNNPGNLKVSTSPWQGKVPYNDNTDFDCSSGQTKRTFEQFTQYKYGIRALVKLLYNYITVQNRNTITSIITRYAPNTENNSNAYISYVANRMGMLPSQPIQPTFEILRNLTRAIAYHENGTEAISNSEFNAVWDEFFSGGVAGMYRA